VREQAPPNLASTNLFDHVDRLNEFKQTCS